MNKFLRFLILILVLSVLLGLYTLYDNNRVVVVSQQVEIQDLPPEFEGFTILQLSDLHSKRFGKHQEILLAKINATRYDMLVITGDMIDRPADDNSPFFELLDGIQNRELVYYVNGNTGPWGYGLESGQITPDGRILESKGVHNLTEVFSVQRGEHKIYISEFLQIEWVKSFNLEYSRQKLADPALNPQEAEQYQAWARHATRLIGQLEEIRPEDVLICVTHGPFSIDSVSSMPVMDPEFDLLIAGHYHGGQFRIPLIGAFYIPDGASERHGFLPPQDRVSGLKDWGSFQQYISRGLGASGSIPIFKFRLFNTPEINLITLVAKK